VKGMQVAPAELDGVCLERAAWRMPGCRGYYVCLSPPSFTLSLPLQKRASLR